MKGPPSDSPEGEEKEKGKVKNAIRTATLHFSLLTLHFFPSPRGGREGAFSLYSYVYSLTQAIAFHSNEICTFHPLGVEGGCFLELSRTEALSIR